MLPSYEIDRSYIDNPKPTTRTHRDKYVRHSHDMTDDTAEASARTLIRTVPLVYGALLGGLIENLILGVSLGLALSIALDSRMGHQSLTLPFLRPLHPIGCPVVAALARGFARVLHLVRLAPSSWIDMRCEVSKP